MRTVLMVLFDQVQSLDVTGPLEVFAGANTWRTQDGDGPAYDIRTASLGGEMVRTSSGLRITPDEDLRHFGLPRLAGDHHPADPGGPDLLIVPGGEGSRRADSSSPGGCGHTVRARIAWSRCARVPSCSPRPGCSTVGG